MYGPAMDIQVRTYHVAHPHHKMFPYLLAGTECLLLTTCATVPARDRRRSSRALAQKEGVHEALQKLNVLRQHLPCIGPKCDR